MIKNSHKGHSIITKLLVATISVFVVMMILYNYLVNKKYEEIAENMTRQVEFEAGSENAAGNDQFLVIINEVQISTMAEYRLFAASVMALLIICGGVIFVFVIRRLLRPLKELTNKVYKIDIANVDEVKHEIPIEKGSVELIELSASFQTALNKIYEDYNKQKRFSVNVAHELRTPLAVLRTKIDVFKKQKNPKEEDVKLLIDTIGKNVARLSDLVEEILFLSRDCNVKKEPVNVRDLAEEIIFDLEEKAQTKDVTLSVNGEVPVIYSDDTLLERVLYNLTDNAIKYNVPGGKCEIRLSETYDGIVIDVADTGVGIKDKDKNNVFDLFYRVDESRNRETGGYGVGLALVRDIAGRLGGSIVVMDNEPKGSIFRITLNRNFYEASCKTSRRREI